LVEGVVEGFGEKITVQREPLHVQEKGRKNREEFTAEMGALALTRFSRKHGSILQIKDLFGL
jgi:hypothetical protein